MRISIINLNLVAHDAIGQCVLHQVRFFRRRGDEVRVYVEHPPAGVPDDVAALVEVVDLADLIAHRAAHFARSELYVYHYPGRYALMESLLGLERGAVIFYYHNVTPPEVWGSDFDRERLQHSRESVAQFAHYADLIVTDSAFNADELVEEHGCERDRVRVLPLAVPLAQFSPGPRDPELLRRYDLAGRRVLLFVGRMAGNKRVDLLVAALPRVLAAVPEATLLLVGDDRSNPALRETVAAARARAEALGVTEQVTFAGRVAALPPYYRLAEVYATASMHEGFGQPLIEAMASGVPVVASRLPAHAWVLEDAGLLVPPEDVAALADALIQVLTDDDLHGDLVRRGLARARAFSLERYEDGWAQAVAEAAAWLPDQPYPPVQPLAARRARQPKAGAALDDAVLTELRDRAEVVDPSFALRSRVPVVGPLIVWVRRNLTSHVQAFLDPLLERQVRFNRLVSDTFARLRGHLGRFTADTEARLEEAAARQAALERRVDLLEGWTAVLASQLALEQAARTGGVDDARLAEVQARIDALQARIEAPSQDDGAPSQNDGAPSQNDGGEEDV